MWLLGGRVQPGIMYLLDPVNSFGQELAWDITWRVTPVFSVNLAQRFFINPKREVSERAGTEPRGAESFEPWGLAGANRGRSETGLRLTWEF
jgi:hypothetical protein